jgi:predicted metal-dependent hydrolase
MQLIDINTLTFVALHELAHLMTSSIGHKKEFWDNFTFMLEYATEAGLYRAVDYAKHPSEYCGLTIDSNPLY